MKLSFRDNPILNRENPWQPIDIVTWDITKWGVKEV